MNTKKLLPLKIQLFAAGPTMTTDMVIPKVWADMISAKLPAALKFTKFAKVDTTLVGRPGDTISVPKYDYIGDATDVAEGVAIEPVKLSKTSTDVKIKKAGKGISITDEAKLSAYGDPEAEGQRQLVKSIASKINADCVTELNKATKTFTGTGVLSYNNVVSAVDVFGEEDQSAKAIFVNPKQVTQLRLDPNFLDINKYPITNGVVMTGTIGQIAGCQVIPSNLIKVSGSKYKCPIVKLETGDPDVEEDTPALTIYMKRDVQVEYARDIFKKVDAYTADEHYVVSLSNASKVVLLTVDETAALKS